MRRPARCLASSTREVPETRPPPLRADARHSHDGWRRKTPTVSAEPEAINPAVERREASVPDAQIASLLSAWDARRCEARSRASSMRTKARSRASSPRYGACGPASLVRERVPLHPSACRRSAPSLCEGNDHGGNANLGGAEPREKDHACVLMHRALDPRREAARQRRLEG